MTPLRILLVIVLMTFLAYLCLQVDQGRLKGSSLEPWRLVPTIVLAFFFARFGKYKLNSISAMALGGIGGAVGTLDPLATVYGGTVGLVTGAIATLIPLMRNTEPNGKTRH